MALSWMPSPTRSIIKEGDLGARLEAVKLWVFQESHKSLSKHFHVALKLSARSLFLPLKTEIRYRSGLASH